MQRSPRSPEFRCQLEPGRERVVVRMVGELDIGVADDAGALLREAIDAGSRRVVLDLAGLTFLDSAGIHMFIDSQGVAEGRGCAVSLVRGQPMVHRVFELTATEPLFSFVRAEVDR